MEWKSLFNFYSDGVEVVFVHLCASCIEVNRVGIFLLIRLEIYRENVIRHKYPIGKVNTVAMESWLRLQNKYMVFTSSAR